MSTRGCLLIACAVVTAGNCSHDGHDGETQTNAGADAIVHSGTRADAVQFNLVPPCGTGAWQRGTLEIHHIDVRQGDSTLIVAPSGRTMLIDVAEPRWDGSKGAEAIGAYVRGVLGCARLDYVLITHFHLDHAGFVGRGGLWHLANVQGFAIGRTLHRDSHLFVGDSSGTLNWWRDYLDGSGRDILHPEIVEPGRTKVDLGTGVTFTIVASDGGGGLLRGDFSRDRAPPNENDYSVSSVLRFGKLDYFIGGDLTGQFAAAPNYGYTYHDIETRVARLVGDVDVIKVSHHGSEHSSNATFLAQLDPEVAIISCGNGNTYRHPSQATVDRLLGTSAVYLTERGEPRTRIGNARVGGNVVLRSADGSNYTVNDDAFVATDPVRVDADGDGFFREADPDDASANVLPNPNGGCDPMYQLCGS